MPFHPNSPTAPAASSPLPAPQQAQRAIEGLLGALRWRSTVFHVGQYCGAWRASTAGRNTASFHLVLRGDCLLHRPGHEPLPLQAGDAVFFTGDEPHHLGSARHPDAACAPRPLVPTLPDRADGTALACGFFEEEGPVSAWLLRALRGPLILRRDAASAEAQAVRALFGLMRDEADRSTPHSTEQASPTLCRLVDLLLTYLLRHAAAAQAPLHSSTGIWALAGQRELAPLLLRLLDEPCADWSAERMAATVNLSRAAFFRRFQQVCGEAPAQFLLRLRMLLAAERLQRGDSVERAAEHAGFQSPSAFHRAFVRVMGSQPGRFRRAGAARPQHEVS